MTDRNDLNAWIETYKETFVSFAKAQQESFKALERFARFHYAVAGDCLEAGLAQGVSFAARGNLLLLAPPLVIGERELGDALELLDRLLGKLAVSFATPGNLTDTIPPGGKHA